MQMIIIENNNPKEVKYQLALTHTDIFILLLEWRHWKPNMLRRQFFCKAGDQGAKEVCYSTKDGQERQTVKSL